jgi:hypothetical protein
MLKKIFVFAIFLLLVSVHGLVAQKYVTSLGARLGEETGLSLQQRIAKEWSIEGILLSSWRNKDLGLKVLAEKHHPILGRRLNMYYGGGIHWNYLNDSAKIYPSGLSGIVGLELSISRLNISWDFLPSFNIWYGDGDFTPSTAVSLRYILIKEKKKKKHWRPFKKRN